MDLLRAGFATALASIVVSLIGCANGYQQFYREIPGATQERIATTRVAPPTKQPLIDKVPPSNFVDIADRYFKAGYNPIGWSSFTSGGNASIEQARQQAINVGADLVVVTDPKYLGSETTTVPITTPTSSTSFSNVNGSIAGAGGTRSFSAAGTTTTFGSTTTLMPMTVHRMEYGAIYFIKAKTLLGAAVRELTASEKSALQTSKGVAIRAMVDGSPAYMADLLPGDLLTAINGAPITTVASFSQILESLAGSAVTVTGFRSGAPFTKQIQLNSR